ncbi:hypothetical protein B0A49_02178 [Cryomyces minteri]|uniref:Exocyst complex component Sec3 PIP2-binding N-terminal domain-containing protein n=1 Tax=Cryomyces minteri TaxID=331657 RepID=A0A4U0XQZ1_9PEZI|nr:hypothetical protein B0A49_02178 [Cryomyces minteri]
MSTGSNAEDGVRSLSIAQLTPRLMSSAGLSSSAGLTRAERFEDEKRRIIDSCFSKVDANGQLAESYITHIRVQEDAAYPSSPPPPSSTPDNKKPRLIVIAVRSTGRVRMHKARENSNGSFSIGKTWNLEDLSAIESFSSVLQPSSAQEQQRKLWAGEMGFVVTIAKPYYWQAGTAKEKEFFIASLVKIYKKYTKGQTPDLIGFDPKERDMMLGLVAGQSGSNQQASSQVAPDQQPNNRFVAPGDTRPSQVGLPFPGQGRGLMRPPEQRASNSERSERSNQDSSPAPQQPPLAPRQRPSEEPLPLQQKEKPGTAQGQHVQVPYYQSRDLNRQPRPRASMGHGVRQASSREQMRVQERDRSRSTPLTKPSLVSSQRLTPQSSHSELGAARSESPGGSSISSREPSIVPKGLPIQVPGRPANYQNGGPEHVDSTPMDGASLFNSTVSRWRPNEAPAENSRDTSPLSLRVPKPQGTTNSAASVSEDSAEEGPRHVLPERRRPPMVAFNVVGHQDSFDGHKSRDNVTPLPLSGLHKDQDRPPSAASSSTPAVVPAGRMPGGFYPTPENSALPTPTERPEPPSFYPSESGIEPASTLGGVTPEPTASTPIPPPQPDEDGEVHRPGLGPMIKKKSNKDVASTFRKAATAYNAFKPRVGGAAERVKALDVRNNSQSPDGINGVVPAPSLLRQVTEDEARASTPERVQNNKIVAQQLADDVPQVTVSSPESAAEIIEEVREEVVIRNASAGASSTEAGKQAVKQTEHTRRHKRRSEQQAKYLASLNIDPNILEGRGLDFESILNDFGWGSDGISQSKKIELSAVVLETDLRRELGRVEAGSWLGHLEQKDERVETVEKMLDRAIAECDELDGLLTLYGVELSSLNDDVAFIEAQSQGLQVQTANQKLLHTELQHLVNTISISPRQLEPLKRSDIGSPDGLEAIESSLLLLYKALNTIDPALRQGNALMTPEPGQTRPKSGMLPGNGEISDMRALQDKKAIYLSETAMFLERLKQHLDMRISAALSSTKDALVRNSIKPSTKLDPGVHDLARSSLWQYSPLLLFTKEIDFSTWQTLMRTYYLRARSLYSDELRDNITAWKKAARQPAAEDAEVLFTSQDKDFEGSGMSSAARKLTVKRSQTLAKSLRSASGDKTGKGQSLSGNASHPYETFASVVDETVPLISMEQNFIVDFFHATSLENIDFADAVAFAPPSERRGTNLYTRKLMEPDRGMARRVGELMEEMFGFWAGDLQNLVEWAIKSDPLQGIGILTTLSHHISVLTETSQEFLSRTFSTLQQRLAGLFARFVDDQIRAIEDTKVKIKKRKGIIMFMRVFPNFSAAIENTYTSAADEDLEGTSEVRVMIDEAYARINKAMFESLKVIAKETPAIMTSQGGMQQGQGPEPEDKEALNYHILLVENMNHYIDEVDDRNDAVLGEWKGKALMERAEHLELYVVAVIRRPLGKLLDFLESTESLLATTFDPPSLATRPSHSRAAAKKALGAIDAKELRRGVDTLRKRVEKHFGDADDAAVSRNLVAMVLRECERKYVAVWERTVRIVDSVYEGGVEIEWRKEDVAVSFRRQ